MHGKNKNQGKLRRSNTPSKTLFFCSILFLFLICDTKKKCASNLFQEFNDFLGVFSKFHRNKKKSLKIFPLLSFLYFKLIQIAQAFSFWPLINWFFFSTISVECLGFSTVMEKSSNTLKLIAEVSLQVALINTRGRKIFSRKFSAINWVINRRK